RLVEASGYELLDGSPAIDAASSLMPPELDLVGNPRPCGDGPDIGAFEHGCAMLVRFRRGDANLDAKLDLSDAVFVLDGLFEGGTAPVCDDAADVNDDGRIDISDPIVALRYLFLGAPASIAAPGLDCGEDLTDDALECAESGPCGDV
ncbi:MAG TPA: choice-of-anchor Q domain-containing protein, partial [Planctomycetota bacterium]|nr:choice-of-anchor Q domain-containing protein [Planctomycetota bacterium]